MNPADPLFRSAVMVALGKPRLPSKAKLTEEDRRVLAEAVAAHFKRSGWTIKTSEEPLRPDPHYGPAVRRAVRGE